MALYRHFLLSHLPSIDSLCTCLSTLSIKQLCSWFINHRPATCVLYYCMPNIFIARHGLYIKNSKSISASSSNERYVTPSSICTRFSYVILPFLKIISYPIVQCRLCYKYDYTGYRDTKYCTCKIITENNACRSYLLFYVYE